MRRLENIIQEITNREIDKLAFNATYDKESTGKYAKINPELLDKLRDILNKRNGNVFRA